MKTTYDSDDYPKGPYGDGGGEADTPQHCDACGTFLENPLTTDGARYVAEAVAAALQNKRPHSVAWEVWRPFYDVKIRVTCYDQEADAE